MILEVLIIILATWRLTSLTMYEKGPFNIFGKLRFHLTGIPFESSDESFFQELLGCVMCFSVWSGAIAAVFSIPILLLFSSSFLTGLISFILMPFAYSTTTIFLDSFFTPDE